MSATIKQIVTVGPGGVLEVRSPDLHEGDRAEVTVIVTHATSGKTGADSGGNWRRYAGAVNSKDAQAGDNHRIDADLAAEYGGTHPEP